MDYDEEAQARDSLVDSAANDLEIALRLELKAKRLAEQAKEYKDSGKSKLEKAGRLNGDTKAVGNVKTIIKPNRKFNEAVALQHLTPEQVEEYSTPRLDQAKLKENFSPKEYTEKFMKDFGFSVELQPLKED